jgi:putative membrane protein insertion efficiency factor
MCSPASDPLQPEPESAPLPEPDPPRTGFIHWIVRGLILIPSYFLIFGVRLYQIFLSPIFGNQCRFQPSCSHYFIQAVRKYGAIRGSLRGVWRILRCHPYHPGGYDPP